ncbi:hypothetical protein D2E40_27005 [Mycobacteroides abscessus]|nr:hypothetical protein D2E40_27005 [Mycobacteroides abscessus]
MSIREQLAEAAKPKQRCTCCSWVATQSADDRKAIEEWVAEGKSIEALVRVLRNEGLPVGPIQFRRHVRECVRS